MIGLILNLLGSNDWIVKSDIIEQAKGKHELATNIKTAKRKIKRQWHNRK